MRGRGNKLTMSPDSLIPESVAREILLNNVEPVTTEKITLEQAGGRVLSEDLKALRTQPPFNASAMDGYAVRQADIQKLPAKLKLVGVSRAGLPYSGKMKPGEAIRIFTGAVVPSEADSIVIQENTQSDENAVEVFAGAPTGKFIRPAGLDFEIGETLLKSGTVLSPNKLALVASMNHEIVPVYKKPRIGIMATGDELVLPGQ